MLLIVPEPLPCKLTSELATPARFAMVLTLPVGAFRVSVPLATGVTVPK